MLHGNSNDLPYGSLVFALNLGISRILMWPMYYNIVFDAAAAVQHGNIWYRTHSRSIYHFRYSLFRAHFPMHRMFPPRLVRNKCKNRLTKHNGNYDVFTIKQDRTAQVINKTSQKLLCIENTRDAHTVGCKPTVNLKLFDLQITGISSIAFE